MAIKIGTNADGYVTYKNPPVDRTLFRNINGCASERELIEYTLGLYPQIPVTDSAVASFTDGADDIPVKSLTVNITPVQSGSGDPSPENVRPISGWTGANVCVIDTNLWNEEWEVGGIDDTTGEKVTDTAKIRSKNYIFCSPSTAYYVSSNDAIYVYFYTGEGSFIARAYVDGAYNVKGKTITTPSDCSKMLFKVQKTTSTAIYGNDISINYPSTDHDYHAYNGNVYSISFPTEAGTVYGGTLDVTNGVLTVTNWYVDLGTLNWSLNATNVYFLNRYNVSPNEYIKTPTQNSNYANLVCSKYARNTAYNVMNGASGIGCTTDGYLVVVDTNYADATAFKESLSGVQLVYELLEPKTYQLTPTEVATILGQNNIFCDTGDIAELTYRADLKSYIDSHVGS